MFPKWTVDTASLIEHRENVKQFRARLVVRFEQASRPLRATLVQAIGTEPGSPTYPLRWKNKRQKRKVMKLLREQNNLPYQRTHELVKQWRADVLRTSFSGGGVLRLVNYSPIAAYVQGDWQQPFHKDTKWPHIESVRKTYSQQALKLFDGVVDELMDEL